MSTVSGLNAKGEKGKSKYVALDINNIYKGKSLENPKTAVQPKYGLQSLGKVAVGRRMPPPANLPSLKSENSGNNPNVSLVPSGGQGWGSANKEKGKSEDSNGNQQPSPQSQPASSPSQTAQKPSNTSTTATTGVSKTWSSVTSSHEDGGQERTFLGQQSPFFPQEFPKLAGGDAPTEGNQKPSVDSQYGQGPSLRPQLEGSWGRGTAPQQPQQQQQQQSPLLSVGAGGLQQSGGSGVNGQQQLLSDTQSFLPSPLPHLRDQRPYSVSSRGGPLPPNSGGTGSSIGGSSAPNTPMLGNMPPGPGGPGMGGPMGPGSALHPPPQFRGMLPSFMYQRNSYPSRYPNFSGGGMPPPPPPPTSARQPYPYPESRRQPVRPLAEEEAYQRPAAIITEKALKGFDEILQNDTQDTWATSHGEIDYNAKLVFSDDEDAPAGQKKEKRDMEEKLSKNHSGKSDKEHRNNDQERPVDRDREGRGENDWSSRESRTEKKSESERDWNTDRRGESYMRDGDDRWKNWSQQSQGRSGPSLNIEMQQRHWPPTQPQQRIPFDFRGTPPAPSGGNYPHVRMGPGQLPQPPPPQQHPSYTPPRPSRQSSRLSSGTEDEDSWRQHRKQHSDEMNEAVERARQRRAEEEKRYEQSKQFAQEKAKALEKNEKDKKEVINDHEEDERSRHSSENRDEKPPSRDGRDRDRDRERERSQSSYQFQKNVPPRFQKQQAELMRQQQTQPVPMGSPSQAHFQHPGSAVPPPGTTSHSIPSSGAGGHGPPPPMPMNYDPRWGNQPGPPHPPYSGPMSGGPQMSKMGRPRSGSQGSGTDSYESDRCTPDQAIPAYDREARDHYFSWDRRPQGMHPVNWHTQSSEAFYDQKGENCGRMYEQRDSFKRDVDEKSHGRESERSVDSRERDFETQDYRYKGRDSFKERNDSFKERSDSFKERNDAKQSDAREPIEKPSKSTSWSSSRDYDDRMPDPFEETHEPVSKPSKERPERHERMDRWEKERPQRPDSRDSRASRDSLKEERHVFDKHDGPPTHSERERQNPNALEDKEKPALGDWGDTPYPLESTKRREWHHPIPITPKQFESIAPPKKNLTTLKRSNLSSSSQNVVEKKMDSLKEELKESGKADSDLSGKKEKDIKEEKNERIKNESKDVEKKDDKLDVPVKPKPDKDSKGGENNNSESVNKDESVCPGDKIERDPRDDVKKKFEQMPSRNDHTRDRRRDGRDRGPTSRSRGGSAPFGSSGGGGRYDSTRGRGAGANRGHNYGNASAGSSNTNTYHRGKMEYRRTRVERVGPRFERQKEHDKVKDKKDKRTDESSDSEAEDGKLGHLRQKDEDSEVSVDEASASTTESAQAEKYQNADSVRNDEKSAVCQNVISKDIGKTDKNQKDKRDGARKDIKHYEFDRIKEEKGGFAPRGEPSRRGRGGNTMSFRNSRGGSRHGPSNYGPPPSKAAFGSQKPEKVEDKKDENKEINLSENKNMQMTDHVDNSLPKEMSQPRSIERSQIRRTNRYEQLPPRLQKRQARRYDNYEQPFRGRGRGRPGGGYQNINNQLPNKGTQGGKENLSDVANEEWETASESSDVAERRDRHDASKDDSKKKERDKGTSSKKSFSGQRPSNDGIQGRKPGPEPRRNNYNSDRNRTKDGYSRDIRNRDPGRGKLSGGGGGGQYGSGSGGYIGDKRVNNAAGNSRPHNMGQSDPGRNNARNTQSSSKPNHFPPKNESTTAVYRVDEIKLQDPNSVQAALADLTNRGKVKGDVSNINKAAKLEKDKTGLEAFDLNNYASVVVIDDHPEVAEESNYLCDADDGFQEVTSKKRHKLVGEIDAKKSKKETHVRNKSGSRSRQSRLPPRFAKQRESNQLNLSKSSAATAMATSWDMTTEAVAVSFKQVAQFGTKDTSPAPPPSVNAWEKPITHSLQPQSSTLTASNQSMLATIGTNVAVSAISTTTSDVQALASSSKSSSFDRSDQHDSGIDVSDQPASAASSQRSSPSNDCKITPTKNATDVVTDTDIATSATDNLSAVGNGLSRTKETESDEKALRLPVTFPTKEAFGKAEEGSDMKLEFTFDSGLDQLTEGKNSATNTSHVSNKSVNIGRSIEITSRTTTVSQPPVSPSADELNLKIASVKKVWENAAPLPTVKEHTVNVTNEENACPTSYGNFAATADPVTSAYNSSVDLSSQGRKENIDSSDVGFRDSSPLQQTGSNSGLVSKTVDHSTGIKSQVHIAQHSSLSGPTCAGAMSPPLVGGLETAMTGIRTITGLASSVQVAGIPAIPSPPTVLFNSSQQMAAQTGMYHQPLQLDGRQNQAAAVAAAMVQFSQSAYATPLGTYGLGHQPNPNAQLSNAYGQQNLFVQQHQGQDMYSSSQYRVPPPYPQSQHVSSSQVLSAQQNIASSHLLGSQLMQARPTPGPSPAAPHLQGIHSIQAVQPAGQASYFSTSAQAQNAAANFFHQPSATPGSQIQQQTQFTSHQGYGSQSALSVLPQATAVAPNYRNYSAHQYKAAAGTVIGNMVPESSMPLRAASRSPTVDTTVGRNVFAMSNATAATISSSSSSSPAVQITNAIGKIGQTSQSANSSASTLTSARLGNSATNKVTQYALPQSQQQQHYYPFGQQKFMHAQQQAVIKHPQQAVFPGIVRSNQAQHSVAGTAAAAAAAAAANIHYPAPIQRPGLSSNLTQFPTSQPAVQQPQQQQPQLPRVGSKPQINVVVQGGKLTSAQQAQLRAEVVQHTHRFFAQSKTTKNEDCIIPQESNRLSPTATSSIQGTSEDKSDCQQAGNGNAETSSGECQEGNNADRTVGGE